MGIRLGIIVIAIGAMATAAPAAIVSTTTVPTSLPFDASGYTADGSFTTTVADSPGCAMATYTVNATPVANSAPDGSTPPTTTILTYIGFNAGEFFFSPAGVGSYTVTVTTTTVCTETPNISTVSVPGACQITCPANLTVTLPAGQCQAPVTYAAAAAQDCSGTPVQVQGLPSGSVFPFGTTTNSFCIQGNICCSASVQVDSGAACPPPPGVPALSPWMLALLAAILGGLGAGVLRHTRQPAGS